MTSCFEIFTRFSVFFNFVVARPNVTYNDGKEWIFVHMNQEVAGSESARGIAGHPLVPWPGAPPSHAPFVFWGQRP